MPPTTPFPTAPAADTAEHLFQAALAFPGQDEALRFWARGCGLYSRYFAALARAEGPESVLAANAALLSGGLDAFAEGVRTAQRLGGGGAGTAPG
ncbi:hypothetical protein ACO2Q3_20880 [Caulobacter sp. KR2-114]|uniref:hypothetical protein n=1 Tax=Caulobacter sp. KR2-114 TaxID=3400912 RepID=UPI003C0359AA